MLRSVWANTVPATVATHRRVPPSRRLTTTVRAGSPSRPGSAADTRTPIMIPRRASRLRTDVPAARSTAYQDSARSAIELHIRTSAAAAQARLTDRSA